MTDARPRPTFSGCGMCGAVGFASASDALSSLDMPSMVKSMHHRGPNGSGIFEEPSTIRWKEEDDAVNVSRF